MSSSIKRFQVQSVIFDLFHTLVDPEEYKPRDFRRSTKLAELFKLDPDEFGKYWASTHVQRYTTKSKKTLDFVEEYVTKTTGRPCSKQDLVLAEIILGRYTDLALRNVKSTIHATLSTLKEKEIKLGLLSNADQREVSEWPNCTLAPLFDAACFSYDIGYMKPSMEAYSFVMNKLGTQTQSSIYVGDGGSDELEGAKEAGFGLVVFMKGYVGKNGMRTREEIGNYTKIADLTIDNLVELPFLISKIEKN